MNIKTVKVGLLEVNSYLVWNEHEKDALVIDPGDNAGELSEVARNNDVRMTAVLLTHGHVDHIGALPELVKEHEVPVFLHPADKELYGSPDNAITGLVPAVSNLPETQDITECCSSGPHVLHTPGHTAGSVCFYFPDDQIVFTGDTLFKQSVGRTDLPGGSSNELIESLQDKLLPLPDNVQVWAGHGPPTSIGRERQENPFLTEIRTA